MMFTRDYTNSNDIFYDGVVAITYLSMLWWVTALSSMRMLGFPPMFAEPALPWYGVDVVDA